MAESKKKDEMAEALKKALDSKPLHKITVAEIAEACGINRQSFYYHFKDVYELTEYMYKSDIARIVEESDSQDWTVITGQLFFYALMNRNVLLNTINDIDSDLLTDQLCLELKKIILKFIADREKEKGISLDEEDKNAIADLYKFALCGMIINWFKKGMKDISQERVQSLVYFLTHGLDSAVADGEKKMKEKKEGK